MEANSRRQFLADIGKGMLTAGIGLSAAVELGLVPEAFADEGPKRLCFGALDPLVGLMQETPPAKLQPLLVEKLRSGTELRTLVAAAALANARTFGGEDYVGFHTMMALSPAYHMALVLPEARRPLPVLKVLYRNSNRIQERGTEKGDTLETVEAGTLPAGNSGGEALRQAVRQKDVAGAERTFAALAQKGAKELFHDLLFAVQDGNEVHRIVLPYRAWDLLGIIGYEHAHTLLRQSVRYCVNSERHGLPEKYCAARTVLPKLFVEQRLDGREPGTRCMDDGWVERLSQTLFTSSPEQAAEAAAAALAEGAAPDAVGEAISLAANQLVLRDYGRREREVQPGKPLGSVHGDSIGVHACDSANAWRNMARVSGPRHAYACLILSAYQVALDRDNRGGDFLNWTPRPSPEDVEKVQSVPADKLLGELEAAVRQNDQARACALVERSRCLGCPEKPVFDLLLTYAVSEDGALHAEKYYQTVSEEFAATRPAFRSRQLVALARVTASEYGKSAPGQEEARALLGV